MPIIIANFGGKPCRVLRYLPPKSQSRYNRVMSPFSPPQTPLFFRDIVVIGASAGGVEALSELVQGFPADFPASVFVVLHVPRHGSSLLPAILSRRGTLPARVPEDGETIQRGLIYVAPPIFTWFWKTGACI